MADVEYVLAVVEEEAGREVATTLDGLGGAVEGVAEVQGLGGSIDAWIIAGTVSAHLTSRLLKAIFPFVEARRVGSIKVGDIEIIRPRPEDVARVLALLAEKRADADPAGADD